MQNVLIVGAGLGGCVLADQLSKDWNVTMIDYSADKYSGKRILDVGLPSITRPHNAYGKGGTTRVWHNGLIEIDEQIFREKWPFSKRVMDPFYDKAFKKLTNSSISKLHPNLIDLKNNYSQMGIRSSVKPNPIFYPSRRANVWKKFKLEKKIDFVNGEVIDFIIGEKSVVTGVLIEVNGKIKIINCDLLILAAGGLGTPVLLNKLFEKTGNESLLNAGKYYEDHPSCFVAEFKTDKPLYKLWNYSCNNLNGKLRLPVVLKVDGSLIAFYIRPAAHYSARKKVKSILNDLRNNPLYLPNYFALLGNWDDILDIISFKFGLHFPTNHYCLLMVAEQPALKKLSVYSDKGSKKIFRDWDLSFEYISTLQKAVDTIINQLGEQVSEVNKFFGFVDNIFSSAHHSGTARMSRSPTDGVCDKNLKVYGFHNLYICDGSVIPGSGYANTGLTIAALAMRLVDHLKTNGQS